MINSRLATAWVVAASLMPVWSGLAYSRDTNAPMAALPAERASVVALPVNVTASGCEPIDLNVAAGPVTFSVHNSSSRPLEWEILDGVMVVAERENIPSGLIRSLTVKLAPGDYQITCGLIGNPKGRLHVAGFDGARVVPSAVDLIGPLAEYRVYAIYEIDALVDDTRRLADELKSGDLKSARASYWLAHGHYARIAPIAVFFPDLDGYVDSGAANKDPALLSPVGFHQLEWSLFGPDARRDYGAFADELVAEVSAMQSRFETLTLTPAPTIAGAVEVMGGIAPGALSDESGHGASLSDVRAHVEGVRKIVDLFGPMIARADRRLSRTLDDDLAALAATLEKHENADGGVEPTASLSADERTGMLTVMKRLSGELSQIPAALGFG